MANYGYTLSRVNQSDVYLLGFDTARGNETDPNRKTDGDDFAATVLCVPEGSGRPYPCHAIRYNNIRADQMSGIIHDTHREFGLSVIVYDPQGGGMFVRDELAKPLQVIRGEGVQVFPVLDFGDTSGMIGDTIMTPFRRNSHFIKAMWGTMASDSVLVNRLHGITRNAIQMQRLILPPIWSNLSLDIDCNSADEMRTYLTNNTDLCEEEKSKAELHLMVLQLMMVDVKRNKDTGQPELDSHQMFKFLSKSKKDLAYSFCYSIMAYAVWRKMLASGWKGNARNKQRSAFAAAFGNF